jgi:hypothetical protein
MKLKSAVLFSGHFSTSSGEASPTIWSCYANFKSLSLFISLEIDCFHGVYMSTEIFAWHDQIVGLASPLSTSLFVLSFNFYQFFDTFLNRQTNLKSMFNALSVKYC